MKRKIHVLISTVIGNALIAFAICAFVIPNEFMLGGSTGIALTLQTLLPLRLSVWSAIINGTLFLLGWAFLGKEFAATSCCPRCCTPQSWQCLSYSLWVLSFPRTG